MILKYPSGLYKTQIPIHWGDSGDISYTISSEKPAVGYEYLIEIPLSVLIHKRPVIDYGIAVGNKITTITDSYDYDVSSNRRVYTIGEILDSISTTDESIQQIRGGMTMRHNTNLMDVVGLIGNETEANNLIIDAERRYKELNDSMAVLQSECKTLRSTLDENQKTINETNKLYGAALAIYGEGNDLVKELAAKLANLQVERRNTIAGIDSLNNEINSLYNTILIISELIK